MGHALYSLTSSGALLEFCHGQDDPQTQCSLCFALCSMFTPCNACPARPVAPGDGTGVGRYYRTGALCAMPSALRPSLWGGVYCTGALCAMPFALCAMPFAFRLMPLASQLSAMSCELSAAFRLSALTIERFPSTPLPIPHPISPIPDLTSRSNASPMLPNFTPYFLRKKIVLTFTFFPVFLIVLSATFKGCSLWSIPSNSAHPAPNRTWRCY